MRGSYLAGTNARRVRRALASMFGGAVGKDVVSRTWRKFKSDAFVALVLRRRVDARLKDGAGIP